MRNFLSACRNLTQWCVSRHIPRRSSGQPHVFWKVIREVEADAQLLGDYGDAFWENFDASAGAAASSSDVPTLPMVLQRLLFAVEGSTSENPVNLVP